MTTTVAEQQSLSGPQAWAFIYKGSVARGLDPSAVLAVASKEGAGGGIGDGGHAFGPFQLNNAGGVITGKFPDWTPGQINAWAWTQAGLNYALDGIAAVAKGLTGATAVHAIVGDAQLGGSYGGFERPTNESAEIAGALANYGKVYPSTFGTPSSGGGGGGGLPSLGGVSSAVGDAAGAVNSAARHVPGVAQVEGLIGGVSDVGHFLGKLIDPNFWLRALQILAGAGLAGVGLVLLVRQIGLADPSSSPSSSPTTIPIPVEV